MSFNQYNEDRLDVEIAIIGMAGRFPGADDIDKFWSNIANSVESVRDVDADELEQLGVSTQQQQHPAFVARKVDFNGADLFDAEFFGFAPREASSLDPQQRIFLETVWHAIENAALAGRISEQLVGTYAGCGTNTYLTHNLMSHYEPSDDIADLLGLMNGNDKDSLSARVAYQFNLRGPAITVQTACSTSLVAVHQACNGLLNHEADVAIAGGVWLNLLQKGGYVHQEGAILSADGYCRPFDEQASGTLIGSGAGVVVLKRLRDAIEDGDNIHAVIKGSAVNNDGDDKVGFSAPSITGQTEVILAAQAMADIDADQIDYVEAHGTGTVLGDPIEISALTQAFRQTTDGAGFCAIGSVKSNVGHLDAAAGVTGLIKTVQALKHKILPPSLNYNAANPQIQFESSPFYVNTEYKPWDKSQGPRIAAVSSFGMGGTNAHVIVQEALNYSEPVKEQPEPVNEQQEQQEQPQTVRALPISARSSKALSESIAQLAANLKDRTDVTNTSIANTLIHGRQSMRHRAMVLLDEQLPVAELLAKGDALNCVTGEVANEDPELAFLFPGQGAQHVDMAADLYHNEVQFKALVDECCDKLQPHLGEDLRAIIWPAADKRADKTASAQLLKQTRYTQSALFVIEYSLAKWWIAQGIQPVAMLGHSIGEYVAACISGVFSLDDALKLVAIRGQLLQQSEDGAMLSVSAAPQSLEELLTASGGCDVAAINGPELCVIAGSVEAIERAKSVLDGQGIACNALHVNKAFHSSLLEPVLDEYQQVLDSVQKNAPRLPFVSNVTGQWITKEQAQSSQYWTSQVRATVQFSKGLETLTNSFAQVFIEVGPSETLTTLAKRHPSCGSNIVLASQTHPQRLSQNALQPMRCLAKLWTIGFDVSVEKLCFSTPQPKPARVVELPVYPFERKSYWVTPKALKAAEQEKPQDEFLELDQWFNLPVWQRSDNLPSVMPKLEANQALLVYRSDPAVSQASGQTLCEQFVQMANRLNLRVIEVEHAQGQALEQVSTCHYCFDISDKSNTQALLQQLEQMDISALQVVHFATQGLADDKVHQQGFFSLMALAQAYGESSLNQLSLLVLTDQLEEVTGEETLVAAKATLMAPCRVIPQEYAGIKTGLVDLPSTLGDIQAGKLARTLFAELDNLVHQPSIRVAYRGNYRFTPTFLPVERLPVERPASEAGQSTKSLLKTGGVYLITGGLGGIGFSLATHLAKQWQARLVLMSRSGVQDEAQQQQVQSLTALGAQVLTPACDVADSTQLNQVINDVNAQFGGIDGVIHAAGIAGGGLIAQKSEEDTQAVWSAKVQGTQNLVNALAQSIDQGELDFMLLCSSTTAIVGGMGSLDYCAANAYLDAYARELNQSALTPVISVNWDSWREVGMAAFLNLPDGYGITPTLGAQAFERILSGPFAANVIVSTVDFERQLEQQAQLPQHLPQVDGQMNGQGAQVMHERPVLPTPYAEPEDELQQQLAQMLSEFLGIAPIGINDNLFELGGDSLMAIQLLSKVQKQFGVELQPAEFFKQPTIAELAASIEWLLIEQIEMAEVEG